ncbi:hypothetical protein L9F63_022761 [Diploptera punctata]|uniref:Uncharacterized protein n=1 Tax=Diploptera punctata TaxID=6984 RepID=A0AAD7ZN95_DIPPU|nr:hypothetical protein L9F63_022761 [Diploptera punctata]
MFDTPKWDISSVSEKLNSDLFGFNSSDTKKKLKEKNKKKKKDQAINGNVINQSSADFINSSDTKKKLKKKNKKKKKGQAIDGNETNQSSADFINSSDTKKKLKKNKKKKKGQANNGYVINRNSADFINSSNTKKKSKKEKKDEGTDGIMINQSPLTFRKNQNSTNIVQYNTNKSKTKKDKPDKPINVKGTTKSSEYDNEINSFLNKSKTFNLQKCNQLSSSNLKRKHSISSDSNLLESKPKKKKNEFPLKIGEVSTQECSMKKVDGTKGKLSKREKRKRKRDNKRENTITDHTNIESQHLCEKKETDKNIQINIPRRQKEQIKLEKKLKKSTGNLTEDSLQQNMTKTVVQNGQPKRENSPYKIQKLKNILDTSLNVKQSLNKTGMRERRKNEGTLRERMMRKLKASRFRYLNSLLYTSCGKDSKDYFQSNAEAFPSIPRGVSSAGAAVANQSLRCYHKIIKEEVIRTGDSRFWVWRCEVSSFSSKLGAFF